MNRGAAIHITEDKDGTVAADVSDGWSRKRFTGSTFESALAAAGQWLDGVGSPDEEIPDTPA